MSIRVFSFRIGNNGTVQLVSNNSQTKTQRVRIHLTYGDHITWNLPKDKNIHQEISRIFELEKLDPTNYSHYEVLEDE